MNPRMPPAVILCGGLGLRQRSAEDDTPKPLRRLFDGRPLIVHVLEKYIADDVDDVVMCVGYGAAGIRQAVRDMLGLADLACSEGAGWSRLVTPELRVTFADAGADASRARRLLAARRHLPGGRFLLGYCDILSDLRLRDLVDAHIAAGALLTLTATRTRSRYGVVEIDRQNRVVAFAEKPEQQTLISAGYFVCESAIFAAIADAEPLEDVVIPRLAEQHRVHAYVHEGWWLALDTYKDFLTAETIMRTVASHG